MTSTSRPELERCARCLLPRRTCMCAEIRPIAHRTEVVIVRHVTEAWRSSNSGRIAALALAHARLVDHGREGAPADLAALRAPDTWLVYPEGPPRRVAPAPPPARLVFLDATWSQAKRMRQRLPALRGLPILSLPIDEVPAARLRTSPGQGRVSTIEAIAAALRLVEGDAPAAELERLFAIMIERARASGRR
ncbi:MAG: DTW domain-containing protein [Kofleriaceae bacterium]|nr:DTW domain-containing protein [Kofleriaceae bacterium]